MQLITNANKMWGRFIGWVHRKVEDRVWKEQLTVALRDVPDADKPFYEPLLTNQIRALRESQFGMLSSMTRQARLKQNIMMFKVARRALPVIMEARALVGIQPLQSPVGLAFMMQYQYADDHVPDPAPFDGGATPSRAVRLHVVSDAVQASTRKLQTSVALEAQQDLIAQHGPEMEDELADALGAAVGYEVVNDVLQRIRDLSEPVKYLRVGAINWDMPETTFEQVGRLLININTAANSVGARTRRGPANVLITDPITVSILEASGGSSFIPMKKDDVKRGEVLTRVGTLGGTIAVYSNPFMPEGEIIVGFKGTNGEVDAGAVFAPYVPVVNLGVIIDPITFQPRLALGARYGWCTPQVQAENKDVGPLATGKDYYVVLNTGNYPQQSSVDQEAATQ